MGSDNEKAAASTVIASNATLSENELPPLIRILPTSVLWNGKWILQAVKSRKKGLRGREETKYSYENDIILSFESKSEASTQTSRDAFARKILSLWFPPPAKIREVDDKQHLNGGN